MNYAYNYITITLSLSSLEISTTREGDKLLKNYLENAASVGTKYSHARFILSSLTILGEMFKDVSKDQTRVISEFLGVLDGDIADEIVNGLFWDGKVRISKGRE